MTETKWEKSEAPPHPKEFRVKINMDLRTRKEMKEDQG